MCMLTDVFTHPANDVFARQPTLCPLPLNGACLFTFLLAIFGELI